MKMKLKKSISILLSSLMVVGLLASCGTKKETVATEKPTEKTATEAAEKTEEPKEDTSEDAKDDTPASEEAAAEREKVGDMYKTGLPIVDPGTYSFSIFTDDNEEDNEYIMFPILEEQTGIKVEVQNFANAIAKEKHALALNSGEYADVIGGWLLSQDDILTLGAEEGVFIPLDKYFDDYCPKITEILALPGVRDVMTTPDDHIYSIPYVLEAPEVAFLPYVNTKWLENVGMEMPKTTEEFREVLRAFKAQDANGNGDANDEIPFVVDPNNKYLTQICGWFGVSTDKNGFTMEGDQLVFGANKDGFKEGMKFLSELYAEGLMDPELFTMDLQQWKAKGSKDLYGVATCYGSGDVQPIEPGERPNWDPLPVLTSPNTPNPVYLRNGYGSDILKNQVVITDNAKNPEIITRWWDNFFDLENVLQSQQGPLNITLFKEGEGVYKRINVLEELGVEADKLYGWGNLFPQSLPKYTPNGFKVKEDLPAYNEKKPADLLYQPYFTETIPKYWATSEEATKMADITTAVEEYLKQKVAEWITGTVDIETDWDSYLTQLDKLKVPELLQLRLDALK